ncbi:MAG TPA: dicarboxylate/amino acid:cation symporter [Opitutaceae bacterium]
MPKKRNTLTLHIMIGMAAGLLVGGLINLVGNDGWIKAGVTDGLLQVIGRVFLASLQLLVVPLVFISLVCGSAALDDVRKVGRIGLKTVALYLFTTAAAVSIALAVAVFVQPGQGFELSTDTTFVAGEAPPLTEILINIFPSNPVRAMAEGNMLQVIVFAVLLGLALVMAGDAGKRILALFEDANTVMMKLVTIVMVVAPYGVFALLARTFAAEGFGAIGPLAKYFVLVLAVLLLHGLGVYPLLLRMLTKLSPIQFFRNARAVPIFAFSTASSSATLPVALETAEKRMGIGNPIASFTLPLGATVNMDGTAIMQGVATVFIAGAYGIGMTLSDYGMVVLTATLASIGTAGVPGVGLVMLSMVLNQVGLPVEGIALIIGVDRLLDMVRTAVNVTGDLVVSCIVAKSEGQLDETVFNAENPAD